MGLSQMKTVLEKPVPVAPATVVVEIATLSATQRLQMFELYSHYYCNSDLGTFNEDLDNKNVVILLTDQGAIRGFSTLAVYDEFYQHTHVQVIYSGDTIVDKAYWGQPLLPKAWLQFAGEVYAKRPDLPLYWLLIVKGHRTYRYLPLFSKDYYPRYDAITPPDTQELIDYLACHRFGSDYDPISGLVYFPEPRSYLMSELAVIPEKDLKRPEVRFFETKNPHYAQGDELVCLCTLSPTNLTRLSLKWFQEGAGRIPT